MDCKSEHRIGEDFWFKHRDDKDINVKENGDNPNPEIMGLLTCCRRAFMRWVRKVTLFSSLGKSSLC